MPKILYPLSLLYGLGVAVDRGRTACRKLPRPVISVGNLTWGGTGKTPTVVSLARFLVEKGVRPVVLSRGYFRKSKAPVIVSDGTKVLVKPSVSGDEPSLIAAAVPGAGVMVGSDRYAAGLAAMETLRPDVFILDDGFQHWKLHRDLDIVCINALNPFGNGCLIPSGTLREPVAALQRAAVILITNTDMAADNDIAAIEATVRRHTAAAVLAKARYRVSGVRRLADNAVTAAGAFVQKTVALVSALGENRGFRKTAEKAGFQVAGHVALRDHYWYNVDNLRTFLSRFPEDLPILFTAKDAVRLKDLLPEISAHDRERFYALDIELEIVNGEEQWHERMQKLLQYS